MTSWLDPDSDPSAFWKLCVFSQWLFYHPVHWHSFKNNNCEKMYKREQRHRESRCRRYVISTVCERKTQKLRGKKNRGKKLTVSSSEVGQGVVTLLAVHNILEGQKKKGERRHGKEELNSFSLSPFYVLCLWLITGLADLGSLANFYSPFSLSA